MSRQPVILCIDDESAILRSLVRTFRNENYHLLTADTIAGGLKILESQQIDLVICDFNMPNMNGLDFIKLVKKQYQTINCILLTGLNYIDNYQGVFENNEKYKIIGKPWNNKELIKTIKNLLTA